MSVSVLIIIVTIIIIIVVIIILYVSAERSVTPLLSWSRNPFIKPENSKVAPHQALRRHEAADASLRALTCTEISNHCSASAAQLEAVTRSRSRGAFDTYVRMYVSR